MLGKLALPAIRELIEAGEDDTLREVVNRWLPADLAELVDALKSTGAVHALRLAESKLAAETFAYLDFETQKSVLAAFTEDESKLVLNQMAPDDRTALLAALPRTACRPTDRPARSGRAHDRSHLARLPGGYDRPPDDARLHGRQARLDDAPGARPHSKARSR